MRRSSPSLETGKQYLWGQIKKKQYFPENVLKTSDPAGWLMGGRGRGGIDLGSASRCVLLEHPSVCWYNEGS